jgi:hypothetical protein
VTAVDSGNRTCRTAPYVDQNKIENDGGRFYKDGKSSSLVANLDETREARSDDKPAVFLVSLPKGPAELRTWLYDAHATAQGGLPRMENGYEATHML